MTKFLDVGFDMDGVVYNFAKAYHIFLRDAKGRLDIDCDQEAECWDWFSKFGVTREEFMVHLDEAVDSGYMYWSGELYEYDVAANIRKLRNLGHKVHIVTHRYSGKKSSSEEATKYYLDTHEIEYDSLTFAEDKTSVKCDYFVEDNVKNYDALDAVGTKVYLVDRIYNRAETCGRRRVENVASFVDAVLEDYFNG